MQHLFISLLLASLLVQTSFGKTRRSANHIIPDADFIGAGEMVTGYEGTATANQSGDQVFVASQIPMSLGVSEWLTLNMHWGEGIGVGFKGRILDEFHPVVPSVAIGVRELYHNKLLNAHRTDHDEPEVRSELFLAFSKGFDRITTRFHGGITSYPSSESELLNGFFGVEKYFGGSFYVTWEGWSYYDRLNMALFGTFRFLPENRAEISVGFVDLERLFLDKKNQLEMSLEPDFDIDPIKPAISLGVTYNFSFPMGSRTQFRTIEDLYREQQNEIVNIRAMQDSLIVSLDTERRNRLELERLVDSLENRIPEIDSVPKFYEEIYARLLLYRRGYETKPFDPEAVRSVREEIFAFGEHADNVCIYNLNRVNIDVKMMGDCISLLGMMKSETAVPTLLDILGATKERRIKIEIISALGMIGDRGASYALEQLANSEDAAIAMAASEVLLSWEQQGQEEVTPAVSDTAETFIIE